MNLQRCIHCYFENKVSDELYFECSDCKEHSPVCLSQSEFKLIYLFNSMKPELYHTIDQLRLTTSATSKATREEIELLVKGFNEIANDGQTTHFSFHFLWEALGLRKSRQSPKEAISLQTEANSPKKYEREDLASQFPAFLLDIEAAYKKSEITYQPVIKMSKELGQVDYVQVCLERNSLNNSLNYLIEGSFRKSLDELAHEVGSLAEASLENQAKSLSKRYLDNFATLICDFFLIFNSNASHAHQDQLWDYLKQFNLLKFGEETTYDLATYRKRDISYIFTLMILSSWRCCVRDFSQENKMIRDELNLQECTKYLRRFLQKENQLFEKALVGLSLFGEEVPAQFHPRLETVKAGEDQDLLMSYCLAQGVELEKGQWAYQQVEGNKHFADLRHLFNFDEFIEVPVPAVGKSLSVDEAKFLETSWNYLRQQLEGGKKIKLTSSCLKKMAAYVEGATKTGPLAKLKKINYQEARALQTYRNLIVLYAPDVSTITDHLKNLVSDFSGFWLRDQIVISNDTLSSLKAELTNEQTSYDGAKRMGYFFEAGLKRIKQDFKLQVDKEALVFAFDFLTKAESFHVSTVIEFVLAAAEKNIAFRPLDLFYQAFQLSKNNCNYALQELTKVIDKKQWIFSMDDESKAQIFSYCLTTDLLKNNLQADELDYNLRIFLAAYLVRFKEKINFSEEVKNSWQPILEKFRQKYSEADEILKMIC